MAQTQAPSASISAPNSSARRRRPSLTTASTTTTTTTTTTTLLNPTATTTTTTTRKSSTTLTIHWNDLPPWRRDNPSIHAGYRATSNSFTRSLHSLLYLHNESVNVYTHLLGAVFFLVLGGYLAALILPRYGGASAADVVVFCCFFGGAFACLGMSATYHLVCNHSEAVAKWGNKLDYSGIVLLIVGSYVPALWYGFFCWPGLLAGYLGAIVLLGLGCLVVSWFEHFRTPAWRPYRALMFVGLGLSGVIPILHALTVYGYRRLDERMGLSWIILQGVLYICGAFLYAVRFPECKYPGAFDIWGSSHQIFHVFVVLAAVSHLKGMVLAFDFHHSVLGGQC